MTTFTDQFEKLSTLQSQAFAPARNLGGFAADAFESLARRNYAVLGDFVNFAVEQARLPMAVESATELFERQLSATQGFAEQLSTHAQAYVDLAKGLQDKAGDVVATEIVEPAKKTNKKAA